MKQWNQIFKTHGKVFLKSQENISRIASVFKKNKVKRILDLGCGSGRHTVYLARKGFELHGFDIAEEGIKIAEEWLKKEGLRAGFKTGSIYEKLPYKDNFFDAVISTNAIHHGNIEEIRTAVKEVERVLRPEGFIFITVRKRKFRKFYKKGTVIEKYGKQKTRYKITAPRTYIPMEGGEKGLPHYLFNKEIIQTEFKHFKIQDIWTDNAKRHYCFLARLRRK